MKYIFFVLVIISFFSLSYSQVICTDSLIQGQGGIQGIFALNCEVFDRTQQIFLITGDNYVTLLTSDSMTNTITGCFSLASNENLNLHNANSIVHKENSEFFYVKADNEITVFKINSTATSFQKVQSFKSIDTIGYSSANHLALSEDGLNLYCINNRFGTDLISIFSVNNLTGNITLTNIVENGVNGIQHLDGVCFIKCSHDDNYLFVCTNGETDKTVHIFNRSTAQNNLDWVQTLSANDSIITPLLIEDSYDNNYLYVYDYDGLIRYERDNETGIVNFTEKIRYFKTEPGFEMANSMTISNNDSNLYMSGWSCILCFSRNISSGSLEFIGPIHDESTLSNIKDIKCIDNNKFLCTVSFNTNSLVLYRIDKPTGMLLYFTRIYNGYGIVSGLDAGFEILTSSSGKNFYIVCNANETYAASYDLTNDGKLSFQGMLANDSVIEVLPYRMPSCATITPDNKYIYVGSAYYDLALTTIQIDEFNGGLKPISFINEDSLGIVSEVGYTSLECSIDGKFLYGATDSTILCFSVDKNTGKILLVSVYNIENNGSNGLASVNKIVISNDGKNIYTLSGSAFKPYGLTVYNRDSITGEISFVETKTDVDLQTSWPNSLAISNDGLNIYVFGSNITSYLRNPENGRLNLTRVYPTEYFSNSIPTINYLHDASLSDNGKYLATLSYYASAIVFFERENESDSISFENTYLSNSEGIGRLYEVKAIQYIPGSNHFVVLSYDKLSSFTYNVPLIIIDKPEREQENIRIYPNPTKQNISIHFDDFPEKILNISILDFKGQILQSEIFMNVSENDIIIPLGNLKSGLYIITIQSQDFIVTRKFLKL